MKKSVAVVVLFLMFAIQPYLFCQEEAKPQWWLIREDVIRPDRVVKYVEGIKEEWAAAAKHQIVFSPVNTWSGQDYHYYFFIPIQNYGSLDSLTAAWAKFHQDLKAKMGPDDFKALRSKFSGGLEYQRFYVMIFRPDLSYQPAIPRLNPEEGNYVSSTYYYILEGKEGEAEAIAKEIAALFKSKNASLGFEVLQGLVGSENPVYINIVRAKDPADYYGFSISKELGADGQKAYFDLMIRLQNVTRKLENKDAWYQAELSYYPPKK